MQLSAARHAQQSTDPTAAFQQRLAQIRGLGLAGGGDDETLKIIQATAPAGTTATGLQPTDGWSLNSKLEAPRSPYELRAGYVLPGTLISGINSELPGQIVAQVSQHIYDTATGRHLLIPQGSRLIGSYLSDVVYGQSRVLVAWQRIIFPDGKALDIGTMPGADSAGYAGFHDKVNNHYLRIFGSALLMSAVVAGVSLSQNQNYGQEAQIYRRRAGDALSESLGQVLGNTMAQILAKNLSIAPTLEIRPGYRFNVVVTKDVTFAKPYQAFDY
jgi:type IV secretion system protein VirB10